MIAAVLRRISASSNQQRDHDCANRNFSICQDSALPALGEGIFTNEIFSYLDKQSICDILVAVRPIPHLHRLANQFCRLHGTKLLEEDKPLTNTVETQATAKTTEKKRIRPAIVTDKYDSEEEEDNNKISTRTSAAAKTPEFHKWKAAHPVVHPRRCIECLHASQNRERCCECKEFKDWNFFWECTQGCKYRPGVCRDCCSNNQPFKFGRSTLFTCTSCSRESCDTCNGCARCIGCNKAYCIDCNRQCRHYQGVFWCTDCYDEHEDDCRMEFARMEAEEFSNFYHHNFIM